MNMCTLKCTGINLLNFNLIKKILIESGIKIYNYLKCETVIYFSL